MTRKLNATSDCLMLYTSPTLVGGLTIESGQCRRLSESCSEDGGRKRKRRLGRIVTGKPGVRCSRSAYESTNEVQRPRVFIDLRNLAAICLFRPPNESSRVWPRQPLEFDKCQSPGTFSIPSACIVLYVLYVLCYMDQGQGALVCQQIRTRDLKPEVSGGDDAE